MELYVKEFILPKSGNSKRECQDFAAYEKKKRRFSIADGVSESSSIGKWAYSLVHSFVDRSPKFLTSQSIEKLIEWVKPIQYKWYKSVNWENLEWFEVDKAIAGAFSTLLGLSFDSSFSNWNTIGIGDSCLFQIRDNNLIKRFPIQYADQFNDFPFSLSSNPSNNRDVWKNIHFDNGDCKTGDLFILATDSIAQWFLSKYESNKKPWNKLNTFKDRDPKFKEFIKQLRDESVIKNDDIALLSIRINQ